MLSLAKTRRPACSAARLSRIGSTARQGPHHGAQKSTTTGVPDSSTLSWKFASVTSSIAANGSYLPRINAVEGRRCRCPGQVAWVKASPWDLIDSEKVQALSGNTQKPRAQPQKESYFPLDAVAAFLWLFFRGK